MNITVSTELEALQLVVDRVEYLHTLGDINKHYGMKASYDVSILLFCPLSSFELLKLALRESDTWNNIRINSLTSVIYDNKVEVVCIDMLDRIMGRNINTVVMIDNAVGYNQPTENIINRMKSRFGDDHQLIMVGNND